MPRYFPAPASDRADFVRRFGLLEDVAIIHLRTIGNGQNAHFQHQHADQRRGVRNQQDGDNGYQHGEEQFFAL